MDCIHCNVPLVQHQAGIGLVCPRCKGLFDEVYIIGYWAGYRAAVSRAAASVLRAIPSDKRSNASRENGKKGGRKRRCHECKDEIKPGDSWERHSYGKGRYIYCGNCGEHVRQEQRETDRMEDRRYP